MVNFITLDITVRAWKSYGTRQGNVMAVELRSIPLGLRSGSALVAGSHKPVSYFSATRRLFSRLRGSNRCPRALVVSPGQDEDSIDLCLSLVDNAIQYGEDLEPKGACSGPQASRLGRKNRTDFASDRTTLSEPWLSWPG